MKAANIPSDETQPFPSPHRKPCGSRKDALALSEPTGPAGMKGQATTRRQLADLGLAVTQAEPDHWIVTAEHPLPEIHLYGAAELERFASCKARHYAKRAPKETDR